MKFSNTIILLTMHQNKYAITVAIYFISLNTGELLSDRLMIPSIIWILRVWIAQNMSKFYDRKKKKNENIFVGNGALKVICGGASQKAMKTRECLEKHIYYICSASALLNKYYI